MTKISTINRLRATQAVSHLKMLLASTSTDEQLASLAQADLLVAQVRESIAPTNVKPQPGPHKS